MLRPAVAALALVAAATLAGCDATDRGGPSSRSTGPVQAVPDLPHVAGPLPVVLRPALSQRSSEACRPEPEQSLCLRDGSGYRALGRAREATIAEVTTAPSADHTSWSTTIRFAAASRGAVRDARRTAVGFGGVVLVTRDQHVLAVVPPPAIGPRTARFLGLRKAEAWLLVDGFFPSK